MITILVGIAVFVMDLWTKWLVTSRMQELQEIRVIDGFFSLQYILNPGAAFGILADQRWLFVGVSLIAIGAIVYVSRKPEARFGVAPWALGLLLGGAAGNLVDRIRYGKVVDFFLFYWEKYLFPNFNVADIGITVGVGLLILHLTLNGEKVPNESI